MKRITIIFFIIISLLAIQLQSSLHSQTSGGDTTLPPNCSQCDVNNQMAWEYNDYLYSVGMNNMISEVIVCLDFDFDHWSDIFDVVEGISPWGAWENADECSELAQNIAEQLDTDHMERTLCAEEVRDKCYVSKGCYVDPEYMSDFPDEYCE